MSIICVTTMAHAGGLSRPTTDEYFQKHLKKIYANRTLADQEKEVVEAIWWYYFQHPIDLHELPTDKLEILAIASPSQIRQLRRYMKTYGPPASCYELQAVPSWDTTTIELMLPFITISRPWHAQAKTTPASKETMVYLTPDKLFQNTPERYLGNAAKVLIRYQHKKPNVYCFAFIASKEPHEPFY